MATRFHGWPEQAYTVLLQLGGEPSLETRERLRRHREEQVRRPMIDLLNDLADVDPWYEDFAVWRYASMAYWWQNQCGIVRVARNVEIGFCFNLDSLRRSRPPGITPALSKSRGFVRRPQLKRAAARWRICCCRWQGTVMRSSAMSRSAFRAATQPITPELTCSSTGRCSLPASLSQTLYATSSRYTAPASDCVLCSTGSPRIRLSCRKTQTSKPAAGEGFRYRAGPSASSPSFR
jgi:hypothetical protein